MSIWAGLLVALTATLAMEAVAYVAHRWVMHGFLWSLHKSHHAPRTGRFEKNDWFAVMFALPSIVCIYFGVEAGWHPAWMWVGIGIALYGAIYFGFHDVIVHRRIVHAYVPKSAYMKRIVQAHRLHHVVGSKHGCVSFGFLWAPPVRVLKAQLEARGEGEYRTPPAA
jgi:beta-carotene 3-hydroxylase